MTNLPYYDFGSWLSKYFPFKVQRIPIDAGFTCPNRRDGENGCIYCNNKAFSPEYCNPTSSISKQISDGKNFFKRKNISNKYLAYFQSYTNTYNTIEKLESTYEEALAEKDVVGIVIGTRPDCINSKLLDYWSELNQRTFLMIEFGIETTNDHTLSIINRGHDFNCSIRALEQTSSRGIIVGGHVILGLPGEDKKEILNQASTISSLPLQLLKIHHLQVIKGTKLEKMYRNGDFTTYEMEEYIHLLASYIQRIRKDIAIDRLVSQSPKELLISPNWNIKPFEFQKIFCDYMIKNGMHQGQMA